MLKRWMCGCGLLTALAGFCSAGIMDGFWGRWSARIEPGMMLLMNGAYDGTHDLKDVVLPGAGFGLTMKYRLSRSFFLDFGYSYNWMYFRKEHRPNNHNSEKAAFILPTYTLNGTFYIVPRGIIQPYVTLGGGMSPWWFASKAWGGDYWRSPGDDDLLYWKLSPIVNAGVGLEARLRRRLSVSAEARYVYVFAKDEIRFGTGAIGNQRFFGVRLGVTYYLGRTSAPGGGRD
jgi:hypothetical protein